MFGVGLWFGAYRLGLVKATEGARARAAGLMSGRRVSDVSDLMERFTRDVLVPRLHPGAVSALNHHKERGDEVVMLSAALTPVVEGLARHLEVSWFAGTDLEEHDGVYTGAVSGKALYGVEKVEVARRFLHDLGADPGSCWAYADHETDVDLLELAGHPVAVNPRPALATAARERGWRIIE
jgi:HAD superfamily hydrolase (TIGR01490 family)